MGEIKYSQVGPNDTILDAMRTINERGSRFALVLDPTGKLQGLVTDGDIRRAFLNGKTTSDKVHTIMNKAPLVAKEGLSTEAMFALLSEKISFIPVVDRGGFVKGVITFQQSSRLLGAGSGTICILGMGYVGLTLSVIMAERGFKVFGYDINSRLIKDLNQKKPPFYEQGLQNFLDKNIGKRLHVTDDLASIEADTFIITVGTPLREDHSKEPNIDYLKQAAQVIGPKLKKGSLVILRSTVPVGTTRGVVIPILNESSGLKAGVDYFISYAPERTIEGSALSELTELPQIIGGYDSKSTLMTHQIFREITSAIVDVESLEGAEMVKILNNTFRDVKFSYSNEMSLIGRALGLDMVRLIQAANQGYTRDPIPVPSPGVGGACLTKDSYILRYSCRELEQKPSLTNLAREVNESIPQKLAQEIGGYLKKREKSNPKIFILGFAFKGEPETSDVRGSTTLDLIHFLGQEIKGAKILGYDPIVKAEVIEGCSAKPATLESGFKDADAVVIMNNHRSYRGLEIFSLLSTSQKDCLFVDGWHVFSPKEIESIYEMKYLGIGWKNSVIQ